MNIAGPIKNSPLIRRGFALGRRELLRQLSREHLTLIAREEIDEETGCEGLYAVDADPFRIKQLTCELEDTMLCGRLFDLDVLTARGEKLDRPAPRRCLICGGPAKDCARSRTHAVPELQEATRRILTEALLHEDARHAAALACRALLYEVCTTPKPGLVDREDSGSHEDMDIYTFLSSISTLTPYYHDCFLTGRKTADLPAPETLSALRPLGKIAEGAMLAATQGVNTHKGAIYSLGILCGALGRLPKEAEVMPERILSEAAAMAALEQPDHSDTAGNEIYRRHGITGVRGQAVAGFPAVMIGLTVLEAGLSRGLGFDRAGSAALLHMLACTDDTNMIHRGGLDAAKSASDRLRPLLAEDPYPTPDTIHPINKEYVRLRLSPGGCADLLSLCYFLHFLKEEDESCLTFPPSV